jgi:hypothetical protein
LHVSRVTPFSEYRFELMCRKTPYQINLCLRLTFRQHALQGASIELIVDCSGAEQWSEFTRHDSSFGGHFFTPKKS